jgi:hypothetical protein
MKTNLKIISRIILVYSISLLVCYLHVLVIYWGLKEFKLLTFNPVNKFGISVMFLTYIWMIITTYFGIKNENIYLCSDGTVDGKESYIFPLILLGMVNIIVILFCLNY